MDSAELTEWSVMMEMEADRMKNGDKKERTSDEMSQDLIAMFSQQNKIKKK